MEPPGDAGARTVEEPRKDRAQAGSSSRRRSTRSKSTGDGSRKKKAQSPVFEKLTTESRKALEKFVVERDFEGTQKQAAIMATFLEDELKFDGIDQDDLAAVYDIMGWKAPVNPRAVINNARNRDKFFRGWVNGKTHLSVNGQNFGRFDSKKKPEADS